MAIEAIQEEIMGLAEKEAERQIAQAMKKAEEIRQETNTTLSLEDKKGETETDSLIEQLKQAIEASAKFEIKKLELTSKKDMINNVFDKATEKIMSLDEKTHERLTKILLKDAEKEIDIGKIICNEKTKKYLPKEFQIKTEEMIGGIIAESKDGTLRVDNRYETILEEIRRDALKKIAKSMF